MSYNPSEMKIRRALAKLDLSRGNITDLNNDFNAVVTPKLLREFLKEVDALRQTGMELCKEHTGENGVRKCHRTGAG